MFYIGLDGGWVYRSIRVPQLPNAYVVSCYQTVEETATADCFYIEARTRGEPVVELQHIALNPDDVVI
jgi:hypothetical protein